MSVMNPALEASLRYLRAGFSVLPIRADGSKRPDLHSWDEYKVRPPTEAEVRAWHATAGKGVGIVCGPASGNLHVLDFEFADVYNSWASRLTVKQTDVVVRLPRVMTPGKSTSGGRHLYVRTASPHRSHKLARLSAAEALSRTGDAGARTAIELRGDGGQILAPGCPKSCHKSGRLYQLMPGPQIEDTPLVDDEDFLGLIHAACMVDSGESVVSGFQAGTPKTPTASGQRTAGRPGDDFSARVSWSQILEPHGWTLFQEKGGVRHWTRPGKTGGVSATTGFCKGESGELLYVFSSNAHPLREEASYTPFGAYTALNHDGDFAAATRELGRQGYGDPPMRQQAVIEAEAATKPKTPPSTKWAFVYDTTIIAEGSPDEIRNSVGSDHDDGGVMLRTFDMLSIGKLMEMEFPEPEWVVKGIMSEGLNILAGAPKQGKSMLALNLALTVAGGGMALGNVRVNASDVLYLSLEDKHRRVQSRAVKMLKKIEPHLSAKLRKRLVVATDWPKQDEGGLKCVDLWAKRAEKPGLLIIDVWNRFAPAMNRTGNAYSHDAEAMSEVKRFVENRGFSALIVHHTRKPGMKEPEDFVHEISGTMGLSGTADGILVLVRSRQNSQASLHVTGRDVAEQEIVLEFDEESLTWKSLGKKADHIIGAVQKKVYDHLRSVQPRGLFVKDIAAAVGEKDNSVRAACGVLVSRHLIRHSGHAFSYPGECSPDSESESVITGAIAEDVD